ncbi:MAG TPA: efflux RND transporter periplasmic adaptor subunit [Sphingomonas sp.]
MNRFAALFASSLLCAVLVAGCSKGDAGKGAPPPPHVNVAPPLARDVVDWDEYVGRFEAPQSVNLDARITGVVTQILFRNGQDVTAGQPLFVIDPRPYRAALGQAEAQVASARATLANAESVAARSADLVKAQAVSKEELENDQAQVRTARASLQGAIANADNARLNLSFTTVHAPVSGRVSDRRVSLGDQVTAGTTLLTTVVSLDPIWFTFDGAESFYLKYLREAQQGKRGSSRSAANPVDIQLSDETEYRWHGRMQFVDNALDPQTGTIRAHALVANPDHFLTPGMFGRARLLGSGTYKALLVPDAAIVADQSRKLVFVLGKDNKVVQRPVEIGPEVDGLRAIRDGIAPTDLVLLDGIAQLQPGAEVSPTRTRIKPAAPDATPQAPIVTVPQPSTATAPGVN